MKNNSFANIRVPCSLHSNEKSVIKESVTLAQKQFSSSHSSCTERKKGAEMVLLGSRFQTPGEPFPKKKRLKTGLVMACHFGNWAYLE